MNPHCGESSVACQLSSVCADHIPDGGSAQGALSRSSPLLHRALEAHAHVPARVENAVHVRLVADDAFRCHEGGIQ